MWLCINVCSYVCIYVGRKRRPIIWERNEAEKYES